MLSLSYLPCGPAFNVSVDRTLERPFLSSMRSCGPFVAELEPACSEWLDSPVSEVEGVFFVGEISVMLMDGLLKSDSGARSAGVGNVRVCVPDVILCPITRVSDGTDVLVSYVRPTLLLSICRLDLLVSVLSLGLELELFTRTWSDSTCWEWTFAVVVLLYIPTDTPLLLAGTSLLGNDVVAIWGGSTPPQ